MQQELRDAKRSLKDAVTEKDAFESKYNDVLETMEVTMLDKEMAEEKAENLQYEVDMLKEKVEEINVDLHVFQQEEGKPATSILFPCSVHHNTTHTITPPHFPFVPIVPPDFITYFVYHMPHGQTNMRTTLH